MKFRKHHKLFRLQITDPLVANEDRIKQRHKLYYLILKKLFFNLFEIVYNIVFCLRRTLAAISIDLVLNL